MRTFLTCIFCYISVTCFSQTKLIAHKSHSGSNANFRLAMNKNLFDIGQSNFGIVVKTIKNKVDTVSLNNNTILLHRKVEQELKGKITKKAFVTTINKYNQPQFFKVNNKEGLKELIKKTYGFDTDSAAFIGFDKNFYNTKN